MSEERQKRRIKVHVFNDKGEESVVPFTAIDWNVNEHDMVEIVDERPDEDGDLEEQVIATFNDWAYVEFTD